MSIRPLPANLIAKDATTLAAFLHEGLKLVKYVNGQVFARGHHGDAQLQELVLPRGAPGDCHPQQLSKTSLSFFFAGLPAGCFLCLSAMPKQHN